VNRKIIGIVTVFWGEDWLYDSVKSVIDFVDEFIIWHNKIPYITSTLKPNPEQFDKIVKIYKQLKEEYPDKIKYHFNEEKHHHWKTENGIYSVADMINNRLLFKEYDVDDFIMYIDSDEIFIPEQLAKIRKIILSGKYDQYKIYQRHYIRYPNLWMHCPTNPFQTILTKNVHMSAYIRNHKEVKTFTFPENIIYYKHMAYCPHNIEDMKTKLIGQVGIEPNTTIDVDWYENVFLKITQDNYKDFRNFSFIKEYPHHMPFINKEVEKQ